MRCTGTATCMQASQGPLGPAQAAHRAPTALHGSAPRQPPPAPPAAAPLPTARQTAGLLPPVRRGTRRQTLAQPGCSGSHVIGIVPTAAAAPGSVCLRGHLVPPHSLADGRGPTAALHRAASTGARVAAMRPEWPGYRPGARCAGSGLAQASIRRCRTVPLSAASRPTPSAMSPWCVLPPSRRSVATRTEPDAGPASSPNHMRKQLLQLVQLRNEARRN